ncbi:MULTISPECIES: GNAT family N-acetyltransferase [Micromonospora]|nr:MULTISPECIES: GNAT family N-acetyltransferase [Micromonospora]NES12803.1 GNAT family N-acetyltransferase [Micromonospora sp. PPF5-17B]NES39722.1 GNAT family N-acetyltransferase [Micromonospora solifontis]NES54728.1 GNAT family N-acetyltransferase [Micromonospora sp. PPF5-6]
MAGIRVRPAEPHDREDVTALHHREWGGPYVVVHDTRYDLRELPTLVAVDGAGRLAGALVHRLADDGLEVVSLAATSPGLGAGTALLVAAEAVAVAAGAARLWLVTTNDNLDALRFYQRRGLRIVAVDAGAVDRARELKPTIPWIGADDIPLRDELRLERRLTPGQASLASTPS